MRGLAPAPVLLVALTVAAHAADPAPAPLPFGGTDWTITVGGEGRWQPTFEGARRNELVAAPVFDIRRMGTPYRFRSPRDGYSFALFEVNGFHFGPVGKIRFPRKQSDDRALRGLGDVDWAFEAGVFAEFWWASWLRSRAELRHGFGGHHGVVAEFNADVVVPVTPRLTVSAGPRVTLSNAAALDPYFGITPAQAAASGLPVFNPQGGSRAYGAGAQVRYAWTPQLATYAYVEYDRLSGSAAKSPLVRLRGSADQTRVGLGATYTFDLRGLWLPIPGR